MDLLRQRRARRRERHRVPPDLPRPDAGRGGVLARTAQDRAHQPRQPDHLDRRFHRLALRQERGARRDRDGHRGRRDRAVHRAAAEGGVGQRRAARGRDAACAGRRPWPAADPVRHRVLRGAAAGGVRDPFWRASSGCRRAPRGPGGGDRVRIGGQAGGVPRDRRVRDLRHVRRLRRSLRPRRGRSPPRAATDAARRPGGRVGELGLADRALRLRDPLSPAPVPGRGGRERERIPYRDRELGLPPLHAGHEPVRAADRLRRAAALSGRNRRRRHLRSGAAACRRPGVARSCSCSSAGCRRRPAW